MKILAPHHAECRSLYAPLGRMCTISSEPKLFLRLSTSITGINVQRSGENAIRPLHHHQKTRDQFFLIREFYCWGNTVRTNWSLKLISANWRPEEKSHTCRESKSYLSTVMFILATKRYGTWRWTWFWRKWRQKFALGNGVPEVCSLTNCISCVN
jgi:hypothetical protein